MNNFIKKLTQFSFGSVISAFISFITVPLITYFISPTELGRAGMFLLAQNLMRVFLCFGMDQAYTREFHVDKDKEGLFLHALAIPFVGALLVFIIFIVYANSLSYILFGQGNYQNVVVLIGAMGIFIIIERFILLLVRMEERALEFSLFTIINRLAVLIATLLCFFFLRKDFLIVVYSTIFGQILGSIILILRYRKMFNVLNFTFSSKLFNKLSSFGFPLIFSVGIGTALSSFDKIALRSWSTFEQLGIYTAGFKIVGILLIIQSGFTTFWVPMAYRWHHERRSIKDYQLVSEGVLTLMVLIFIGILFFSEVIISILSPEYEQAQYLLGFLILCPIMYTVSETTTLGIAFSRKSYLNIIASVIAAIFSIGLNFFLVPIHGALGAATATAISYAMFFLTRTFLSFKVWKGFSVKKHITNMILLFLLAFANASTSDYVKALNILSFALVLIINKSIIKVAWRRISVRKILRSEVEG